MKFRYFILRFENAVESLEIIEFDINIPSGIGAQQFERPAHLIPVFSTMFTYFTLVSLSDVTAFGCSEAAH